MPHREFIHSASDVSALLYYALNSGMQVMVDTPQPEPQPRMVTTDDVPFYESGVFSLFKPEWVFGEFQVSLLSAGHNAGKFFVQRVNFTSISVYFSGEGRVDGRRKLGSGVLSYHSDWLEMPAKLLHSTPTDVQMRFKQVFRHLSSGAEIRAGVHRYHVCQGVINDPQVAECLPPFDYIPWDAGVVTGIRQSKTKRPRKPQPQKGAR